DAARNVLQVAFAPLGQEKREEVDLEEEVAQLVAQLLVVAALGGVRDLVGLLDRVRDDRPRSLLAVPRTIAPQPLGQLLELEQRLAQELSVGRCSLSAWYLVFLLNSFLVSFHHLLKASCFFC